MIKELRYMDLSLEMREKATALKEGGVMFAYNDHGKIRIETYDGENPYVWRQGSWEPMTLEKTLLRFK